MCQKLEQGKAEELRGEVKINPQKHPNTQVQHKQRRGKGHSRIKKRSRQDNPYH